MSIASAHLSHVFGVREGIRGAVTFQDEQTILYPCGSALVLYNIDQHAQKFIVGNEKAVGMTSLAVSPNRRYVAVAEKGEKATITIYDLHSLRKKKTLSSNDVQSGEFVSIAFSPDSKYLVAQGADPDWTLVYWSWEKSKQLATLKPTSSNNPNPIHQVSFNPQDSTQIAVAGQEYFKIFRYTENNLKPSGLVKIEPQNFLCHTWISDEKILVGTDTGKCILLDNGEQKMEFNTVADRRRLLVNQNDSSGEHNADRPDHGVGNSITAIINASKGFAVSCAPGTVLWYEKTDEKELFKAVRIIRIPSDPNSADPMKAENQVIQHMCISPSEDMIVAATDSFQLYSIALASAELGKTGDVSYFEYVSQSFHSGQVLGLDLCIRKPVIATCGVDRSVRIWNYETNVLELYKEFAEEAYSIALHPSGLYVVVGFSDKLRLMNILIDDIRTFKEFPIRGCRECCFSNGGHFFAAVYGNVIQIYSTTTFENVNNLKGHNGKIRSICWTQDDSKLISCGMDGAVYEWEPTTGKRLSENVLKSCSYSDVTISPDGKNIFAVGSDKTLKEINDSQIKREMEMTDTSLSTVVLSRSGKMLFCGTLNGTVRAVKFPLTQPGEWQEHFAHSGPIVKMKMSYHDDFMVTVSEDGSVMLWRVSDKEGRGMKRDKETGWAEEILITKSDLEEKNANMTELKTRVEELKMENEYQLRLKDMNYNEKIKELTEKFIQEMESLKTKNQVLKTEKDKEEAKHEEELQDVMEKHGKELQDLESANNQKLMLEYEKYQELQTKSQKMQEDYERQIQDMEEKRVQALRDVTEEYETKLAELQETIDNLTSEMGEERKGHEQSKCLIEEDADREILDTKIKYERQLREEKEKNIKLKGETGIMRKKFNSQQKEIEDFKVEIAALKDQTKAKENIIKNLEKDIAGLKKEIQERDETIQDKEKRIYDLKKKNQELEKFKFVLDYKIRELKKQIEPRENDIKSYKEQIQEMESELERFHKQNTQLELSISELKKKMKSCENELKKERQSTRDVEAVVRRFKTDLHNCVGYIQEPKMLKESIVALYKKHVQDDVTSEASVDADIQKEFARQREHLERSVASLKKKLVKDTEIHRADYVRIMQENVSLIKEINDLRRELKTARTSIHDLEAALGLHRKNNESAKELLAMVTANKSNPMMEEDMDELKRVLDTQKTLIGQLRGRIRELESRPLSATGRNLPAIESI